MFQPKNFHAMEVAEMPDIADENNVLENTQDGLEQDYVMEEDTFCEVQKTVEDIVQVFSVVEDTLETVTGSENIIETITVIEDDPLETVTAAKNIIHFVKTDEDVSNTPPRIENKTSKTLEMTAISNVFEKNIWCKFGKKGMFDKVLGNEIAKEASYSLLTHNALPSRKDFRCFKEFLNYLSLEDSNQTPLKELVVKMNFYDLISHYTEYRRKFNNDLSKLYNSRNILNQYLEESSFIAEQCRFAITDTNPTPDVSSVSEQELKTINRTLMEKVSVYKECLRSLCWNLDSVNNKIRHYKSLNATIDLEIDNFLNFCFSDGKKKG
ncbi:unnamed protein product [Larinioides sclopetarius]|uniref:Uncharacterized protein n=1 Tax=Larinioides sclopetarius TaxID=280406 RepID=A0AAV1ZK06_9ARAC